MREAGRVEGKRTVKVLGKCLVIARLPWKLMVGILAIAPPPPGLAPGPKTSRCLDLQVGVDGWAGQFRFSNCRLGN